MVVSKFVVYCKKIDVFKIGSLRKKKFTQFMSSILNGIKSEVFKIEVIKRKFLTFDIFKA